LTIGYGMTETSPVSFQSATDDPLERRVSTVGRIHPHVEVKVVDLEGRVVPRGEPANCAPAATASCWDIGTSLKRPPTCSMPTAGCTPAISPPSIGTVIATRRPHQGHGDPRRRKPLPARDRGISLPPSQDPDVQIFGVADDRYGEELCAWIRTRSGETLTAEEVRSFCQGQIAHNKIPRYIEFVDEFR